MTSRRRFLGSTTAAIVGGLIRPSALTGSRAPFQEWPSIADAIVINALGGISNPNPAESDPGNDRGAIPGQVSRTLDPRAVADAVASGTTAVNVTLGYVAGSMDPFEHTVSEIATWNAIVRNHADRLTKVWSGSDIDRAKREGKVGVIFGFQNAAMVGEDPGRVDTFADLGVRVVQLTYNVRNQVGDGSMEGDNRGLTDFGRDVLTRLNERRVLVDLSHSGERTCLDAVRASRSPIAITHTGCRALTDLPRNKTDEELRLVAEGGGVVGIYFMPFLHPRGQARADDVVAHVEHAVDVCGEDHVGIGTDGGTTRVDDIERFREAVRENVRQRAAAGIGATGESEDVVPMIPDLQGPDQFRKLAGLLQRRGHPWSRIEKILGGNFHRLMTEVWG